MTLIYFSDIPWHGLHQRPQHIASRLAQRWAVLWVEPVTLLKKPHFTPVEVEPGLHILSLPAFPYNARSKSVRVSTRLLSSFSFLRRVVLHIQLWTLRRALRLLRINHDEIGFFVQNFQFGPLVDFFTPRIVSFDYIDNAFGFRKFPKHVHDMWLKTLKRSDVISVTSQTLKKQIEAVHTTQAHVVSNGVEYGAFAIIKGGERPQDLPQGNPIVGYVGAINTWFDFDLLNDLLSAEPDMNFVVIGSEHPEVKRHLNSLSSFKNFFFLGFRPYKRIPSYLKFFSVGIIPFKKNELTAAVNPVKLYEYSAAGVPTVATDFSEDLREFEDLIFVARSSEEFATGIREALSKSRDHAFIEKIKNFARQNDWNTKAAAVIALVDNHVQIHS